MARYEDDLILWAKEQAKALLERRFADLDVGNLAIEISIVAQEEARVFCETLGKFMLAAFMGDANASIKLAEVRQKLRRTPSLARRMLDQDFLEAAWADAALDAITRGRRLDAPESCPFNPKSLMAIL